MKAAMSVFALLMIIAGCSGESDKQKSPAEQASGPAGSEPAGEALSDAFEGTWSGTVHEKGSGMPVEFELKLVEGKYGGTFTIMHEKSEQFEILNAEVSGSNITFIIPIEGKIDYEAVQLKLELKGDILAGSLKEMKEHKEPIPVSFKRKKTP